MRQGVRKIFFYLTFAVLGTFWAEVVSTNLPTALLNPFCLLAYGLLYVFFLDLLMRWEVKDLKIWYLFGVLVGFITETYVAKVTFFGSGPDAYRILGLAPWAIAFIIFFYHAFFSFVFPAYLAKRLLAMPLALEKRKGLDILFILIPFIMLPIVNIQLVERGWSVAFLSKGIISSAIVLFLMVLLLRSQKKIKNVLLTAKEKKVLLFFTVAIYILFLFSATNENHRYRPLDFPILAMLAISVVIGALLILAIKNSKKDKSPIKELSYEPKNMNLKLFSGWFLWHFCITFALLFINVPIKAVFDFGLIFSAIIFAFFGIVVFGYVVVSLTRRIGKK